MPPVANPYTADTGGAGIGQTNRLLVSRANHLFDRWSSRLLYRRDVMLEAIFWIALLVGFALFQFKYG